MAEGKAGEIAPVYLTLSDVLEPHALIIGATAAEAADQLRNRSGLESVPKPTPAIRPDTFSPAKAGEQRARPRKTLDIAGRPFARARGGACRCRHAATLAS